MDCSRHLRDGPRACTDSSFVTNPRKRATSFRAAGQWCTMEIMEKHEEPESTGWLRAPSIPLAAIRHYARRAAETFRPDRIILFGSRAYGRPHRDSDVDLLIVMPARNEIDQAVRIRQAVDPPFFLDLLVCTPTSLRWRLEQGDSFLREVVDRGRVLYEKTDAGLGEKGRRRLVDRKKGRSRPRAPV
jgi:uncharacterized protein